MTPTERVLLGHRRCEWCGRWEGFPCPTPGRHPEGCGCPAGTEDDCWQSREVRFGLAEATDEYDWPELDDPAIGRALHDLYRLRLIDPLATTVEAVCADIEGEGVADWLIGRGYCGDPRDCEEDDCGYCAPEELASRADDLRAALRAV